MPAPALPGSATCRLCGAALGALRAMRSSVCERPACRQRDDAERLRRSQLDATASLLAAQVPPRRAELTPVAWIRPHEVAAWVPPPLPLRAAFERHLSTLAADPASAAVEPAPEDPADAPAGAAELRLCAWCQGRCCRHGGGSHAYLDATHLRRWQQAHPGRSLADAAREYLARLPPRHAEGSCLFHGPGGCALDRTMRASVCNRFACDGLRHVQQGAAAEWLFVMGERSVQRAALADAQGWRPAAGVAG